MSEIAKRIIEEVLAMTGKLPKEDEGLQEAMSDVEQAVDELIAAALAEKDQEIERWKEQSFRPLGDNHHNAAACPYCSPDRKAIEADRNRWKKRAELSDTAFLRALQLLNDCRMEKSQKYTRLPQDGCECETCNLFRAALEDEKETNP